MKCEVHPSGHLLVVPENEIERAWIQFANGFKFDSFYREERDDLPMGALALMINKRQPPQLVLRTEE